MLIAAQHGGRGDLSNSRAADWVEVAEKLSRSMAEGSAQRDLERTYPKAQFYELAHSGLLRMRVPARFGGPEVSFGELGQIFYHLGAGDPNLAQAILPHVCLMEKLRIYATQDQQRRYFSLAMEDKLFGNAVAEIGSKVVGEITTTVRRAAQGHRINGRKYYSTGSLFSDLLFVLCVNESGLRTLAIVPTNRAGLTVRDDWDGMGQRTTSSGTVTLENVAMDDDEVIVLRAAGKLPTHEGATAQLLHSALDAGIARAALDEAVQYGRHRARAVPEAGVSRAGDDPFVQHTVGEMALLVHGAEAMLGKAAAVMDACIPDFLARLDSEGHCEDLALAEASIAVAEAKMACEHAALRVCEMMYRIGGASATARALNFDRHWRNARTHTTHDPVSYKAKIVGDYYLNGRQPPISTKF